MQSQVVTPSVVVTGFLMSRVGPGDEGFTVTFGSAHNTPALEPIKLRTRDAADLSAKLKEINYRGACTVAAHQHGLKTIEEGDALITKTVTA